MSATLLRLEGRVDAHRVDELLQSAYRRPTPAGTLFVDLSNTTFLDEVAIAALLDIRQAAELDGGAVRITRMSDVAQAILEITALGRVLLEQGMDARKAA
jgi:anti-anti-sigma factor